ncbi:inner membrane transporter RhtA [Actinomadura meyerae]|uniref:Inner membrane transporter RhtA n=1 Tax=Actinomadura meyerae TaxID=240840 RepID=A0A239GSD6_9ACTN|nr:EamA family transporter [Actinomadura meyerae]SNS71762.1 inner membrane transporter RhtA [Actinomadura meyerae]
MALAEAPGSIGGAGRAHGLVRALSPASVPPPALILLGIVSVQVGAGLAKHLFERLPPTSVVSIRLLASALVLGFLARRALLPVLRGHSWTSLAVVAGYGVSLAGMNFAFYQSLSRIPLGVAVTIEFLGPLSVAIAGSRRPRDLVWVALAAAGVLMLARGGGDLDLIGIGFALLAAIGWAAYILLTAATGRRIPGTTGLALASIVGTLVMLPGGLAAGVAAGGGALLDPTLLLIGLGVGLLSSVIPYSLELEALRRVPARVFGILMSLEPAVAALVGLVVLGEVLSARQWVAVGCVIVACAGATRGRKDPPEAPEA